MIKEDTGVFSTDVKKQFWKSQRFQIAFVLLLIVASLVLPKIPLLRGWEYKLTTEATKIAKDEIPNDAIRIKSIEEALHLIQTNQPDIQKYLNLKQAIPIAAWACKPLKQPGLCVRYLLNESELLTMVVTTKVKKNKKKLAPFTKGGWGGYLIIPPEAEAAFVLVGHSSPDALLVLL
ncbi:MAG: hypothetical protein IPM57_06255 [Oligoflexia bacterium]|nr:hypothetical protein [Oligoflexia bacterium]